MQKIANILPFRYVSDLSFRIYVGDISIQNGIYGIFIQLIWLFITITIGYSIMRHNIKRVVVQGG